LAITTHPRALHTQETTFLVDATMCAWFFNGVENQTEIRNDLFLPTIKFRKQPQKN
jgi:hypothetical protein